MFAVSRVLVSLLAGCSAGLFAQESPPAHPEAAKPPLGAGPAWRGPVKPTARNEVFATGDGCAMCHSSSRKSSAMRSATGEDVSPHALWSATVMANSFRDPFWRAQVAREVAADPDRGEEVQALCLRCHAPMLHHSRRLAGQGPIDVAHAAGDALAKDGVSCTVCHQIQAAGLGADATWAGKGKIDKGRRIFGPFADPVSAPMQQFASYQVMHGPHVQSSGLCATCHTLHTEHTGESFPEQVPFLEWRNSVFSDEAGRTDTSRTCQECHMADLGRTRIARDPDGADFLIAPRAPYRSHGFVGGNAMLLDLLADNAEDLGVTAPEDALRLNARASRRLLAEETVAVSIGEVKRSDAKLRFAVRIENLTGHKFPTGFPSRRAWLQVQVRQPRVVFESGRYTKDGHLLDVEDELGEPHRTKITDGKQVAVFEMIANDVAAQPTTLLTSMRRRAKDNRLLPKGWKPDGPHAADTAPVGIGDDRDFVAGSDTVEFEIPYPADAPPATVVAWVLFQTMPPHWIAPLREIDAPECRVFVAMYDAAKKTPETLGTAVREETR